MVLSSKVFFVCRKIFFRHSCVFVSPARPAPRAHTQSSILRFVFKSIVYSLVGFRSFVVKMFAINWSFVSYLLLNFFSLKSIHRIDPDVLFKYLTASHISKTKSINIHKHSPSLIYMWLVLKYNDQTVLENSSNCFIGMQSFL